MGAGSERDDGEGAGRAPAAGVSDEEVIAVSFENWYATFEGHAWRAEWMRPGEAFARFLLEDGVRVGPESDAFPDTMAMGPDEGDDGAAEQRDAEAADDGAQSFADFPEVASWIRGAIGRLGGRAVPKLNWSCPYDATWMMASNSVCCTTADEVMLLLKSSDRACHDLSGDAFDPSAPAGASASGRREACAPVIVLKKYFDILPGREFRCFVYDGGLVGAERGARTRARATPVPMEDAPPPPSRSVLTTRPRVHRRAPARPFGRQASARGTCSSAIRRPSSGASSSAS